MCTVSWIIQPDHLEFCCNRDEFKERGAALPPQQATRQGVPYIAPIDSQAGGTWLAVNEHGLIATLLNHYPDPAYTPPLPHSRGELPMKLMACCSLEDAQATLLEENLSVFPPFYLITLMPNSQPRQATWDGRELAFSQPDFPVGCQTSSSYNHQEVSAYRKALSQPLVGHPDPGAGQLLHYHLFPEPQQEQHAVRVERAQTQTVSVSHITITPDEIRFAYRDRPPFLTGPDFSCSLSRAHA